MRICSAIATGYNPLELLALITPELFALIKSKTLMGLPLFTVCPVFSPPVFFDCRFLQQKFCKS